MLCLVRGCFDRSVVGPVVGLGLELALNYSVYGALFDRSVVGPV